jgi:hypothetical protein
MARMVNRHPQAAYYVVMMQAGCHYINPFAVVPGARLRNYFLTDSLPGQMQAQTKWHIKSVFLSYP